MIHQNIPNGVLEKIKFLLNVNLFRILILLFLVFLFIRFGRVEIIIYHGPYSAFTPVSLQKRIQNYYDHQVSVLNLRYLLKAVVENDNTLDYLASWNKVIKSEKKVWNSAHLYSMNTATWLMMSNSGSGRYQNEIEKTLCYDSNIKDSLKIIGYKKQDILYYMPLFVWHKDSNMFSIDSVKKQGRKIALNRKKGSGCSNMIPTIYLLEKYEEIPSLIFSKQDVIKEVVSKKQLVGVISTDEYNTQLDDEQKEELFIDPIPVNIPLDPIVVKCCEWNKLGAKKEAVKDFLKEKNIMVDVKSYDGKKMGCLGEMLYFYLSMPILNYIGKTKSGAEMVKIVHWGIDGYKRDLGSVRASSLDSVYFCKVNYACLGKEYYSFDKEMAKCDSISEGQVFISDKKSIKLLEQGYNRLVFSDQTRRFDNLQDDYNNYFK